MSKFRITWRHEVIIEAGSELAAEEVFMDLDLGNLDQEILVDGKAVLHSFVEVVSGPETEDPPDLCLN